VRAAYARQKASTAVGAGLGRSHTEVLEDMANEHKGTTLVAVALLAFVVASAGCQRKPNVLLISIDSLRADHVGVYGYGRNTTPTLDRLATSGARFETAVSSTSWTLPAHIALLTGLPDTVHGVQRPVQALDAGIPTLTDAMRAGGYHTVGFYSGPFLHPLFGFARGFDDYIDCTSYGAGNRITDPQGRKAEVRAISRFHRASHRDVTNPRIQREVLAQLDRLDRRPFFFFVHMWDVHYDYIPPPPYDRMFDPDYQGSMTGRNFHENRKFRRGMPAADFKHIIALYDGEIRYTDDTVTTILHALDQRGLLDNTLVVVTADHGDEFLDHGRKGHRTTLFDELVRIPLLFSFPGRVPAKQINAVVSIIDIAPTILDLVGLAPMPDVVGRSLTGLMREGPPDWQPRAAISELDAPPRPAMQSIRDAHEKLIRIPTRKRWSYFDLTADPKEQHPIQDRNDPRVRRLSAELEHRLEEYRAMRSSRGHPGEAVIDPATEAELRSLGYLD